MKSIEFYRRVVKACLSAEEWSGALSPAERPEFEKYYRDTRIEAKKRILLLQQARFRNKWGVEFLSVRKRLRNKFTKRQKGAQ